MTLRILTPTLNRTEEAEAVFLPGTAGAFEVLRGHAPLISTLKGGEIRWRTPGGQEESFAIATGAVLIRDNVITICAEV